MAGTDETGKEAIPFNAPDGAPYDESDYPIAWTQSAREKGIVRKAPGGRSFEAAVAVVNGNGQNLDLSSNSLLVAILDELKLARDSRELAATQNVRVVAQPEQSVGFASEPVVVGYGASSGALDANDAYGDLMEVKVPKHGRLDGIKLFDADDQIAAGTLSIWVFSTKPLAPPASDAAIASGYVDVDGIGMVTAQSFGAITDIGSGRFMEITDINSEYFAPQGRLWFQLSTTGTPTPTAGGMPVVTFYGLRL